MSKPAPIQISIPHPCTQSWDEMTPDGQGRHCAHCQKTVVDFTGWSDAALYNYFSKNTGYTCGRFLAPQVNRPIYIPHQPHSRLYRMTIALGLTLLFTQTPDLLAQTRTPIVGQVSDSAKYQQLHVPMIETGSISGQAVDDKKEPLINAAIIISREGAQNAGAITDYDGFYKIDSLVPGIYNVVAIYSGYDSVTTTVTIADDKDRLVNFTLRRSSSVYLGLIDVPCRNYKVPLIDQDNPTKTTISRERLDHMPR